MSPFQAFAISAGSRVGTGNIAGVATAIVGGPGAVFWMWVIAFIGAASAFIRERLWLRFIKYMIKMVDSVVVQLTILLKV
ncbi:alanine:cation symporter family protein [Staphylococcus aureus]